MEERDDTKDASDAPISGDGKKEKKKRKHKKEVSQGAKE